MHCPVQVAQTTDLGAVVQIVRDHRPENAPGRPKFPPIGRSHRFKVGVGQLIQRGLQPGVTFFQPGKGGSSRVRDF